MFEARYLTQATLSHCEAMRRARSGDEVALAATHRDANAPLVRVLGALVHWLINGSQVRIALPSLADGEPAAAGTASPTL